MYKKDSKSELKPKFKQFLKKRYMNVFLVFALVLISGVLSMHRPAHKTSPRDFLESSVCPLKTIPW